MACSGHIFVPAVLWSSGLNGKGSPFASTSTHLVHESVVHPPLAALYRVDFFHHLVNLFQGEAFRFGDEDKGEDAT